MSTTMESSIAEHLKVERTFPTRKGQSFHPPYPSFSARFDPAIGEVVMAYYGAQYRSEEPPPAVTAAVTELIGAAERENGPAYRDQARYVDEAGFSTIVHILYWLDVDGYRQWLSTAPGWTSPERYTPDAGFFTEILTPTVDRFETLFSNDRVEGISVASDGLSGEIPEHAYWGGARDRMPAAQSDRLDPEGELGLVVDGHLVTVAGQGNLCLIRSGQEWTETADGERAMYLDDVEPVLRAGMDFLRDDGLQVGCYANRYMQVTDEAGDLVEKSFGMSWWRSLEELETWSESHPTHVAIFRAALKYLSTMGPAARLRLYHEVTVVQAGQQAFAYLGCHDRTGLLRATR